MMDPAKLKVVELRAELSKRGLDTKGNKPVLVERLRKALEDVSGDSTGEEESTQVESSEEDVTEAGQKDAREKTPEPTAPSKTSGRTSRSSSATTPTKLPQVRGGPKIMLTPLSEKQMTPGKPSIAEKAEKTRETVETPSKEIQEAEKPEVSEAESISIEKPEIPKEKIENEDSAKSTKNIEPEIVESVKKIEEKVASTEEKLSPAKEKLVSIEKKLDRVEEKENENSRIILEESSQIGAEKSSPAIGDKSSRNIAAEESSSVADNESSRTVADNSQINAEENAQTLPDETFKAASEESSQVIPEVSEDTRDKIGNVETKDDEDEQSMANKTISEAQTVDNDQIMNEIEGNDGFPDETETTPNIDDEESDVKMEKDQMVKDTSHADVTINENYDVEMKPEIEEKPNVDNALLPSEEQQDVEMKNIKEEAEEDSERDTKDRDRKDRKDRKRKRSLSPKDEKPKSPLPNHANEEPILKEDEVVLSWYDSDLNLVINKESFVSATAMHNEGFGYIWAGARASYGFTEGKVYYETKISEYCEVNLPDEQSPHVLRAGWSIQGTSMQLGEEPFTYGYGGTGKISSGNKFSDYGTPFGKDDIVGCYLDFSNETNIKISYTINGKNMGTAFTVSKADLAGRPLFPHILTKNCTFVCNFGQEEKPWSEEILDDFIPVGAVDIKSRIPGPRRPERKEDCEMIMMCGLPAAGKTVWATKYAEDNPEKMYNVLGTNSLIEKMKVIGLPRRRNYHGRWEVLIDKCTRCLNKLLEMASSRRRNYILDQTNVYPSAQRRKMRNFYGYQRRAIVIVPTEEEFKSRTAKRTASEGDVVPDSAVLEMKANFMAPVVGDTFDAVEWIELPAEEGKKLIEKYNKEGKEAGYGSSQANKRPRFERTDNHRDSRDSRQNSRDSRDSRSDHRDRRNNYSDRNRTSTWRGGSNSGGWRDRQPRPAGGHVRHGGGGSSGSGSGGYGGQSSGGWRGRGGASSGQASSYRPSTDRRAVSGHDRRTSGSDRNRSASSGQGRWGPMSSYQSSQPSSGSWGGGGTSQSGNYQGNQTQQQGSWGTPQSGWGQQQQQQWGNWKGYGQGNYNQGNYSQAGYGNGNWGGWNQQYYTQYWGQQQPTSQTSAGGSQAGNTSSAGTTGNSSTSTGSTYSSSYSPAWQGYTQSYSYPAESSNTNVQQQK